ncbi:hypothetical protein [Candidatus Uabimicrobium amorphum]|uniref:Uncharacterized protein n=1 Tax=Uabimicrobium amorphum TaxID=2596890 RepID=A0A5S9F1Y9_UABAM|nr:hypothetical protein [Candidatus Uabimicrobium amorphum]BBM82928.1 hypothetical protein UABAM_01271 [Candidatus Uabimicrobium amorphum]
MDFDVEDYKRRQEARRKKDVAIRRKKARNQAIGATIVFVCLSAMLSTTEMGCDFLQSHVDSYVDPFIAQAKRIDNHPKGYPYYPGLKPTFQDLMKKNFKDSWLISIQKYVCDMNLFWSRSYKAYLSYKKYRQYFGCFMPEKIPEFYFYEMSSAIDCGQFKDCGEIIDIFYAKYSHKLNQVEPWASKIKKIKIRWDQINPAKRAINEFVY